MTSLIREIEQALPAPNPNQLERLAELATRLEAQTDHAASPSAPVDLDPVVKLLNSVVCANHPSREMDVSLAQIPQLNDLVQTLLGIRESVLALSTGDLSADISVKGFVAGCLKTLQAHFKHLTWQTQRVADGDFSQRVDFMGEFASAFNAMTQRLAQSVEALRQKETELTTKNRELEREIQNRLQVEKALRESEERYRKMAVTDYLTGLYNRRHFYTLAENEIKRSQRHGHDLSVVMLDIDHFKRVNDQYGHDCGDRVLVQVSRVVTEVIRSIDICARIGGEEFVLLLPETQGPHAVKVAQRLRDAISETGVPIGDSQVCVTISLGVAGLEQGRSRGDDPREILELLIKQADQALYASKASGRNRVTLFGQASQ